MLQIQLCMNFITSSKWSQGQLGIQIYTWEPNPGRLCCKTELKHWLIIHQSTCRRLCLIQRLIWIIISGVGSLQRRLLIYLIRSMIHWWIRQLSWDQFAELLPYSDQCIEMDDGVGCWHNYRGVHVSLTNGTTTGGSHLGGVSYFRISEGHHNARMIFDPTYPTPEI